MSAAIRAAAVSDEESVVGLWHACGLVAAYNDPAADFRFARGGASSDILVAEVGGQIVGAIMVGHDGHRGWLYYVAVAPAQQKRGFGRDLVRAAEAWLSARGVPKVHLMVRETNTAVTAFYARMGYDPMPRINMQKWLTS